MEKKAAGLVKRFLAKTRRAENGCLEWTGASETKGYGNLSFAHKGFRAHKFAWLLFKGDIGEGLCVCHRCDNPKCIDVDHLWLGSSAENSADMVGKGRNAKGERRPEAILTDEAIREIREVRRRAIEAGSNDYKSKELAKKFGVSRSTINSAGAGETWKHIQ